MKFDVKLLSQEAIQQFVREHEHDDEAQLVLSRKEILGVPSSWIAEQLKSRRKARTKLPLWYNRPGIVYPLSLNLEQSSSEATARYKSEIIAAASKEKSKCFDLTGGFGVDTYFLSNHFETLDTVEPNDNLLSIAKHNQLLLGADNIQYHQTEAEPFLTSNQKADVIYIDPSRRATDNKRVFKFSDTLPDVIALQKIWFNIAPLVVIKASPLVDIAKALTELTHVADVHVISVANDCKELLFFCRVGFNEEVTIHTINLQSDLSRNQAFNFRLSEERNSTVAFADAETYIYEANSSIMKSGAFKLVASRFGLQKISSSTHLYVSNSLDKTFPGRAFLIKQFVKPDSSVQLLFKSGMANILLRNYPMSVEALKKKTGLREGGEEYLIGMSSDSGNKLVVADRVL